MHPRPTSTLLQLLTGLLLALGAPALAEARPARKAADPDSLMPLVGSLDARLRFIEQNRRSPRAALGLWSLPELEGQLNAAGRARIRAVLQALAEDGRAPLLLRRLARDMLAARLRSAGRPDEARAAWDHLGFQRHFWLLGPFDNEGRSGYARAEAPEAEPEAGLEPDFTARTKFGPVAWRPLPAPPADGRVELHPLMLPRSAITAYALSAFRLARPTEALVYLGCDDACKLWLDGVELVADPGAHPARLDQHVRRVRLAAGAHALLVKVAQDDSSMGFNLALTDDRGRPLAALEPATDAIALSAALREVRPADEADPDPQPWPTLAAWFETEAERAPGPLRARRLLEAGLAVHQLAAGDARARRAEHLLQEALAALPPGAPEGLIARLWLAQVREDDEQVRNALEEAAALAPGDPRPHHRLGLWHQVRGEAPLALQAYRRALALEPGDLPGRLGEAEALADLGLEALADRLLGEVLAAHPEAPDALAAAAQLARQRRDGPRATALFEALCAQLADHALARRALYEEALARGDLAAGLGHLDRLLERDPLRLAWWLERGAILMANDRADEALEAFGRAQELNPRDALPRAARADALLRLGRPDEAIACLREALGLTPQDAGLARRIQALVPGERPFYAAYQADPQELLRSEPAPGAEEAGAERLLELHVVRLHPNGMAARFRQQIVRVLDGRGAERLRTFQVDYSPGRQEVRILRSRVWRATGTPGEGVLTSDQAVSEPWFNMYYDVHVRQITFPDLQAGDLVELSTLVEDAGGEALLSDYFGDLALLQFQEPVRRASYVLLAPPERGLAVRADPRLRPEERPDAGGGRIRTWTGLNLPAVEPEPAMPGATETHASLHLSTQPDWPALSRWYHGLVADQFAPTPEVRRVAAELVEGLDDPLERVRAIYRFVADGTRYVGLEFGIHSYVPYQCGQVLQRRFGDCKDKSALLVALFESVGIPARMALVRMQRLGRIADQPASLAAFNHAICHLPGLDLWLDGTATLFDIHDLPAQDQGVQALVVSPEGAELGLTPTQGPERNRTDIRFHIRLEPDGGAQVELDMRVMGVLAPEMRLALLGAETRERNFTRMLRDVFPAAQMEAVEVDELLDPSRPLGLRARLRLADLATREPGGPTGLELAVLGRETRYLPTFAPLESRRHDLVLGPGWRVDWRVELSPPPGYALQAAPEAGGLSTAFGRAALTARTAGDGLLTEASFELGATRVSSADYPAFRAFLDEVDALLGRRARFEPVQARAPEVGHAR
jgi:tetratricopeptide (TPR) repeat protein